MSSKNLILGLMLLTLGSGGSGPAWAAGPPAVDQAVAQLQAELPGVRLQESGSRLTRVYGRPLAYGTAPEDSAELFLLDRAAVFGVEPDDLQLVGLDGTPGATQPLMYDPQTGQYKFTLVRYVQSRDGVPVFRGNLRVLVLNQEDFPVVLAASSLRAIGDFRPDLTAVPGDFDPAQYVDADFDTFTAPQAVIWAGLDDVVVKPVVALTFVAEQGWSGLVGHKKWLYVVDPVTGDVLYDEDLIVHTDVAGTVQGMATTIPKSDTCNPAVATPMAYANVYIEGGASAWADADGHFTIPHSGSEPVTVWSPMNGHYFTVDNVAGSEETLPLSVTPPGPANFIHNQADTSEFVRAQVNGYVQANVVRDFVLAQNPSYPVIATQTGFPVNVNIADTCNAYYDYSSINFFQSGDGCPNTAYSSVVHHEYGHHVVYTGGSGQGQYGEGMSDSIGVLIADDPVCGYGFLGDCNSGIRTAENTLQYPCTDSIHYCGQLLSGCIWDTRQELEITNPGTGLDIIRALAVNSVLLHDGEQITPQITIDFLTLDDDDGNIGSGTPHRTEICTGFGYHNMDCPPLDVGMSVYPDTDLVSSGQAGGPFTPSSQTYTIENIGPTDPITYEVTKTADWITLTNASGTLYLGETAEVTVAINENANSLPDGDYFDTVYFVNATDHVGDTARQVTLRIGVNDLCTFAKRACPGNSYSGTTTGMTVDGSTTCGSSNSTPDVWYKYTPVSNGTATFSLCTGTNYDSVLSIHSACPGTSSNTLGCNDDYCGLQSQVALGVTAGTEYLIRISGWNGHTGNYTLTITGPDCAPLGGLSVVPGAGLDSGGPVGGPFSPDSIVYTLENVYDTPIDYTVSNTAEWISLSNTGGTLAGGEITTVTVSINSNADGLPAGTYTDTVTFTNTTDHVGDTTRDVTLTTGPGWGLDAYWCFDDCTATDCSGHGLNGVNSGAACVEGLPGQAYEFIGTDLVRNIPSSWDDSITTAFTVAARVKWYGPSVYADGGYIFDGRDDSWDQAGFIPYIVEEEGQGWLGFHMNQSGSSFIGTLPIPIVPPDGPWAHVAVVFDDDADLLQPYVNGVPDVPVFTTAVYHNSSHQPAIGNNHWAPGDGQWCPFNGVIDELRIYSRALSPAEIVELAGETADCNSNGLPDVCDVDCGESGGPCDLPGCGQSADCNSNSLPDECEPDCNTNGVADECDIAEGTSADCQPDGVPDECELAGQDCNTNAVPDECDIADGTSQDCQPNGVPDECDIAAGTSQDCQPNEIPDECELGQVQEQQKLTAFDAAAGDWFGGSVAIDGDTAVVGALWDDSPTTNAGAAYVFVRSDGVWAQQAKLVPYDPGYDERFGDDVAIDGDTIVVGAYLDDHPYGTYCGSAYVFTWSGTTWTQQANLTASDGAPYDRFGSSVAIQGNTILIGAGTDDSERGSAYVFVGSGGAWTQQAKLTALDGAAGDMFGYVALDGDTALIGASRDDHPGLTDAGSAYVFVRSATIWTQQAKLTAQDAGAGDSFGTSVALFSGTAVVGAPDDDLPGFSDAGSAYVFTRSGAIWTQQAKLVASDPGSGDNFGYSAPVEGDTAVIGALHDDTGAGVDAGSAYVFSRSGATWTQQAKLTTSDAAGDDHLGESAALQNGTAVVGAYHDDLGSATDAGSAYVFLVQPGHDCNGNGVPDECDVADGSSQDCQPNEVPDECDISQGDSNDADTNGIPDECWLAFESCLNHGTPPVEYCLELSGACNIEPRLDGVIKLVATLGGPPADPPTVYLDCGSGPAQYPATAAENAVTISIDPALPDASCCAVTIDGTLGSRTVVGLEGDMSCDGLVSTGDASIIKPHFGEIANANNAQYDFDGSGLVTPGDFSQVKPRFGHSAPQCP